MENVLSFFIFTNGQFSFIIYKVYFVKKWRFNGKSVKELLKLIQQTHEKKFRTFSVFSERHGPLIFIGSNSERNGRHMAELFHLEVRNSHLSNFNLSNSTSNRKVRYIRKSSELLIFRNSYLCTFQS